MSTLQEGSKAPEFSAKDQNGNTITLAQFKGKKSSFIFLPKR